MKYFIKSLSKLQVLLTFSVLFLTVGCGFDDGLEKRYAVTGKVTYKGQPVAKGTINFMPVKPDGRGATGQILDGDYSLSTQATNDGAFPGEYKVTIDALNADFTQAEAAAKKKGSTSVALPQDMVAKAFKNAKNAVPAKYSQVGSSPLKAEVKTSSNKFDFELTD